MTDINQKIENAKKQPVTAENLNYIGDLYLKRGDKQTAISYYYELAEKMHISQKDKKLAIYKKILNISTSESKAYEKIISIFSRMGLIAEEKKYIIMLANLYQNKGELNKLDALFRRIKEIDSENQIVEHYFTKSSRDSYSFNDDDIAEDEMDVTSIPDDITEHIEQENHYHMKAESNEHYDHQEKIAGHSVINTMQEEKESHIAFLISRFYEGLRKYALYLSVSFLLILLVFFLYAYIEKGGHQSSPLKTRESILQTNNYEITVTELKDLNELTDKIDQNTRKDNFFYTLSVRAKNSCIDDPFATDPFSKISFTDKSGKQFRIKYISGLGDSMRVVYRANTCGKAAAAVFMKAVFAIDKKVNTSGISLAGLEKEHPILISCD